MHRYAAVIRSANEAGRVGVRPAGEKEPILLSTSKLTAVSPFDKTGVSIPCARDHGSHRISARLASHLGEGLTQGGGHSSHRCLRSFRAELAASLDGLSAAEAVASVIMPLTESFGSSLASGLQRQNKTDEAGKPFAAKATAFVCYADGCSLTALLDAIERYAAAQPKPEEIYVWLDLFSADQHAKKAELPLLWWQTSYRAAIKAIGTTCLVLDPWDAEASGPLRRSSCHATLHAAISSETPIKVALTAAEEGRHARDRDQHTRLGEVDSWRRALFPMQAEGGAARADGRADEAARYSGRWLEEAGRGLERDGARPGGEAHRGQGGRRVREVWREAGRRAAQVAARARQAAARRPAARTPGSRHLRDDHLRDDYLRDIPEVTISEVTIPEVAASPSHLGEAG